MPLIERQQVAATNTWDLQSMYSSLSEWEKALAGLEEKIESLASFQGRLNESLEVLLEALQLYLSIAQRVEKIYVYAHLRHDEDTTNTQYAGAYQKAARLYTQFASAASFFNPELLALPEARMQEYLTDSSTAPYRRMLEHMLRYRPHTLSEREEALLAGASEVFSTSSTIFSQLNNADFSFGEIEVDGESQPLTHSTYSSFLKHQNREIRKAAYEQYYATFDEHKYTLAATLSTSVKKDVYLAHAKQFPSAVEASLFSDNVSVEVYHTLISSIRESLPSLHRYYALRQKRSGLKALCLYDTYVPLVDSVELEHSYEQAVEIICQSLQPLGDEYVKTLQQGLTTQRWVDRYENKGKRSGAYSSGCYDSQPYILMNYKDDELRDVYTLTHEAGHSMHSLYSSRNQPYQDSHYTIFVAEVASTFNEQLLTSHLRKVYADDPKISAYLINHQLDDIKSTLFRQTMFAEFELFIHQQEEQGQPLTLDSFREYYASLLTDYFGSAIALDEIDSLEAFRIPHFYSAFYVYKYATGLAAAASLSEKVLSGDTAAVERYLGFLSSGGSKYPLELLEDAGVDMRSPEPVRATAALFERLVNELEEQLLLLDKK